MNAAGHQLVTRVAWSAMSAPARRGVTELVNEPSNPSTGVPTSAKDDDVFNYSTYMDNIRPLMSSMHYVNTPLNGPGTPAKSENSLTLYSKSIGVLGDKKASKPEKAEALRLAGHLVGDIHQPLHNADNNDRGGNSVKLGGKQNLHSYWDQAGGAWNNKLSDKQFSAMAASMQAQFDSADSAATELDPVVWSREGWELAGNVVYPGIQAGSAPDAEYGAKATQTMTRQAVLAGNRWARQLNLIFGDK